MMRSSFPVLAFLLTLTTGAATVESQTQSKTAPTCIDGRGSFSSYGEAMVAVRRSYRGETADTSRSSWLTSAEFFAAGGCGYLIIGMKGSPYIFAGVPRSVWDGFRSAPSMGSFYNQFIKGRYRFRL